MFDFYSGKRVLVTGHTGFKGSWLCRMLVDAGAEVTGYALKPPTEPSLFDLTRLASQMNSIEGDVRDRDHVLETFRACRPEIVLHLAAQPIVRDGYKDPVGTYETNVMGTVNVLEAVRLVEGVSSVVNVTTDKVYLNREWEWGYRENEPLDGFDPYSNSKSCSDLVTHSYRRSFFDQAGIPVSTARAGNVIGGGDFAVDRIIPDCVRAVELAKPIVVRNPHSVRPYQHVLEPLSAYLMIAQRQSEDVSFAGSYNIGPDECDCLTTGELVDLFCAEWGDGSRWENVSEGAAPHEAQYLRLDCSCLKQRFGWTPRWGIREAIHYTCEWTKAYLSKRDIDAVMQREIRDFELAGTGL